MSAHRKPSAEILWRLSTNLRNLRKARGYTQHELSKVCGFAASYIGDVEQENVNITLANLEALAQGLMCLEADLLMPVRKKVVMREP
jgi:transcriptional regulator with XRE-family HTH domain